MALRTFVDSDGREWDAFDVIPRTDERRVFSRRTAEVEAKLASERRDQDRRLTVGGNSSRTVNLRDGWLCFEGRGERRRLSPIPADWQHASDAQLDAYLRAARRVKLGIARGTLGAAVGKPPEAINPRR